MKNVFVFVIGVAVMPAAWAAPADWLPTEDHPRPIWARPWVNLNGTWRFDFDPENAGLEARWFDGYKYSKQITVPYPWQSRLSGIADTTYQGVAWYERDVTIPTDAGPRVFLVFGAVDWEASVWVNGKPVAHHEGGYTPFEAELTRLAKPGNTVRVTVRALDLTDPETPNGKQTGWYTPTGGIWQTVYLESRGQAFVREAKCYTDIDQGAVRYDCTVDTPEAGAYEVAVTADDNGTPLTATTLVACQTGENRMDLTLPVPEPKLWSPDLPTLYPTRIELRRDGAVVDTVETYFGMRKISRGAYGGSKHEYILLNNKPIYLRGALHQSFNPEGIYTHPDDDFIRRDYEMTKEFGLNFLRIHIKYDEPRCLYWADRLGVMIMSDVPNYRDHTPRAQQNWEQTMRAGIARDFNNPSVFSWVNFNETWGIGNGGYDAERQAWVRDMYLLAKQLDPAWLVEDNSPCRYDHTATDINSWHFYIDRYETALDHIANVVEKTFPGSDFNYAEGWKQGTAPLMNSEYGGVSAGGGDRDISWVFLFLTNLLRKYDPICGYIYTELSDIEWEHNGFLNYDRSEKEYHYPAGITLADLQQDEFAVLDCPPYQQVKPGDAVSIPILLSHWSDRPGLELRMSVDGSTVDGAPWDQWVKPVQWSVADAKPYAVTPQGTFDFDAPDARGLMHVIAEVIAGDQRVAANYCVVDVRGASWQKPDTYAVSVPVDAYAGYEFGDGTFFEALHESKLHGLGAGYVEYHVRLPKDLHADAVEGCRIVAEVGAKGGDERLDWPARKKPVDYPQTDGKGRPSDITITMNGIKVTKFTVEKDFADARGVLSHVAHFHHGSSGVLVDAPVEGQALDAVKKALERDGVVTVRFEVPEGAKNIGGLALYGEDMGAYPIDPTLVFTLRPGTPAPSGEAAPVDVVSARQETLISIGPKGHVWRYTTKDPGKGWFGPKFDDSAWKAGKSGFGTKDTPGARIGTRWESSDIWLRTTITAPKGLGKQPLWVDLHHDEDVRVYVNGKLLLERDGHRSNYDRILLSDPQRKLFQPGKKNVIAVHCHQTGGGQFIDFGLRTVKPDK